MDQLQNGHDGMGFLDTVLRRETIPDLWPSQQCYAGFSAAHGDVHLQVLFVSLSQCTQSIQ